MIDEPFAKGHSIIHQIDPRFKIVAATVYSFAVALSHQFSTLLAAVVFSVVLVWIARLDFWRVTKRVVVVNGFLLFFWIMLPIFADESPFYTFGPLSISIQGVLLATKLTLKSNAILLGLISMVSTIPFTILGHSLNRLKIPEKLVFLLLLTYRYYFVIEQEYEKIMKAIKIRGFQPTTSLHSYKTFAYIIGMLFVRASERADRVYGAMRCRGFNGKFYSLADFHVSAPSWIFSGIMTGVTLGILFLEIYFYV